MAGNAKTKDGTIEVPLAVELKNVNKWFGAVHANKDVCLSVETGNIHGIVGENGAGKSTLVNILYGFYSIDSGTISVNGNKIIIRNSADALANGIAMVHQHFMLVPNFTVLENVMLGYEGSSSLSKASHLARIKLTDIILNFGLSVDLDTLVEDLPVGLQQRVEILKALYRGAKILILDEPTGVLTPQETDKLFEILKVLRDAGVTILFITHKLKEVIAITNSVSVMQSGRIVAHRKTRDTSTSELAELMVGRKVLFDVQRTKSKLGSCVLKVNKLNLKKNQTSCGLTDISLEIKEGEILGLAGVAGNGQTELLEILSGIRQFDGGDLTVCGHDIGVGNPANPNELRKLGVAHVPEDRHKLGMVLPFSASENNILGYHYKSMGEKTNISWILSPKYLSNKCNKLMHQFDVRPSVPSLLGKNFSGGNQQKLVLAREISQSPKLLLVGQPTRGVDIGAIEFIHNQLLRMRDNGCAILLVSVELDEIISLADRVIVMNAGRIMGSLNSSDVNERQIGLMMAGISD